MDIKMHFDSYIRFKISDDILNEMEHKNIDLKNLSEIGNYIITYHFDTVKDDILDMINLRAIWEY